MIKIDNPQQCCGCSACKAICPQKAITMEPDVLGFLYPKVDVNVCVECGLCEKICAFHKDYDKSQNLTESLSFGARHKNTNEVESSRSGAAFIALSDWILNQGGVVYGAGYKDHFRVVHKRATTKFERDEFKGSKYVQSDMDDVFCMVKKDLKDGLLVLFSGTACQIAGLKSFIGKRYRENLYLVDIVCHGVPSPYVWRDYLGYLEKKNGRPIDVVNFRDKRKFGWSAHKESYLFSDTYIYANTYTYLFYLHVMFRRSCEICPFANTMRPSDITIADFWGWEKTKPDFNVDDKGCSLILCNTQKGIDWFECCKKDLDYFPAKLKDCIQPNLQRPSPVSKNRIKFERDYAKYGLEYVLKRYGDLGWRAKVRPFISKVRKFFKRLKK